MRLCSDVTVEDVVGVRAFRRSAANGSLKLHTEQESRS
jgi:hypothetical protein